MKRIPATVVITITMLALISSWCVILEVIAPHDKIPVRIATASAILAGQADPPYRYRVLKPLAAGILQKIMSPVIDDDAPSGYLDLQQAHVVAYSIITLAAFAVVFSCFYSYLRKTFSTRASLTGILLLQAVIPLSVTFDAGFYMEGDFITLGFYAAGLCLIAYKKDMYLPALIGAATLNREQMVFLVFIYALHLFSSGQVRRDKLMILAASFAAWAAAFAGVRLYMGYQPSKFTVALHMKHNLDFANLTRNIIPLWLAEVAPCAVLCILAYKKSNSFFRLSFLSLGLYILLFFLCGNMWELAKFLPAFLVMIPMALQPLTGEYAMCYGPRAHQGPLPSESRKTRVPAEV